MKVHVSVATEDVIEEIRKSIVADIDPDSDYYEGSLTELVHAVMSQIVFRFESDDANLASVTTLEGWR